MKQHTLAFGNGFQLQLVADMKGDRQSLMVWQQRSGRMFNPPLFTFTDSGFKSYIIKERGVFLFLCSSIHVQFLIQQCNITFVFKRRVKQWFECSLSQVPWTTEPVCQKCIHFEIWFSDLFFIKVIVDHLKFSSLFLYFIQDLSNFERHRLIR